MTATGTAQRKQALLAWLVSGWYVYVAALVLVFAMYREILPRTERFVTYWYETSKPEPSAQALAQDRRQQWHRDAWLRVVAAPLGCLALFHLWGLVAVFRKQDEPDTGSSALLPSSTTNMPEADRTVVRSAVGASADVTISSERTQIRPAVSLEDEDARLIGNNRYRVERILGSGGMGSVYLGFDTTLKRKVALKSLHMELAQGDEDQIVRFRTEAYALAGLSHPNIVPVYDLFEEGNEFWMVIELLQGGDLDQMIECNPPTIKQAVAIIRAIAKGLDFAHNKNFIHRDVKPMNILFNEDKVPKLVDFGIAKGGESAHVAAKTQAGLSLGSPTYMSPEQAAGKSDIDRRADIYSLGITFYKTLTGAVPFTGDVSAVMVQHITQAPKAPCEINPEISLRLNAIVMKMLAKEREDRYQTLADFITDLEDYIRSA